MSARHLHSPFRWCGALLVAWLASLAVAPALAAEPATARPIAARDTVFSEEMTWMEVRDALAAGKKTVIVATGGVEQNGPYLATGKHDIILRATTEAIARKLGDALVAPIVPFVPEGDIDPPTQHMRYPGTISLTEPTFEALLIDICRSYRQHGFEHIIWIGDSGGNQHGMRAVAEKLHAEWKADRSPKTKTTVHYVPEYYNYDVVRDWLVKHGIKETDEGLHDSFAIEAQMMVVDPSTVRMKERLAAGKFKINGIDLSPPQKTIEWGKRIIEFRAQATVDAIRKLVPGN